MAKLSVYELWKMLSAGDDKVFDPNIEQAGWHTTSVSNGMIKN